ncbi:MAG: hypothetical protein COB98_01595 [Flavobacteriaceae bacterium]|nr:MAG: hypothetical protein COB98_01595 [Flavobacteriaceae bacterium]
MKNNKKIRVVFYLNPADKKLLKDHCGTLNIDTSNFIRFSILEKLGRPIIELKQNNIATKEYTGQLLSIGNNLNQIAKKLNTGNKFVIADQQSVLDNIKRLVDHIIDIKSKL